MENKQENTMIVVRGNGHIVKGLDKAGVIAELKKAQTENDRFASVIGAISCGYDIAALEQSAGYKGATCNETLQSLQQFNCR